MRVRAENSRHGERAYALMIVLFFGGISLMAVAGAMQWASSSSRNTDRANRYFDASAAAEAATEKVLSKISRDYLSQGEGQVYSSLDTYRSMVPTATEASYWSAYEFNDAQSHSGRTYVDRTASMSYVPLQSQYEGLYGLAATYRILSNARDLGVTPGLTAAVRQDIQVAAIPTFQFAIFYQMDLEINPGPTMNITGRVHSNGDVYLQPQAALTFQTHITAVNRINMTKSALDPTSRTPGTITFNGDHDGGVHSLNLPIGTNNTPAAVRQIVEMPPTGEDVNSAMGQQRYYNKADISVVLSNSTVTVRTGAWGNYATNVVTWNMVTNFVTTNNVSFYNLREGKTVDTVQLDVAKLITWSASNSNSVLHSLGRDIDQIYIADNRTRASGHEPGVRLVNGATLPSRGLTVATPDPVYVQGNYNAPSAYLGSTNTLTTRPASIVADAINILSSSWSDANAANSSLSSRVAGNTTVNAAFLAGIVASNGSYYSGGVENFPRFLEDWSSKTFTYNGSMVVMYPSQFATAPWGGSNVYSPPSRNWAFDRNFLDATKLPPGTPMMLTTIRGAWAMIQPGVIQ